MTDGVSAGRGAIAVLVMLAIGTGLVVLLKPRDLPSVPVALTGSPDQSLTRSDVADVPDTKPTPDTPDGPIASDDTALPSMDVVRIDGVGAAVVAGSGARNVDVILRLDGTEVGNARTDADGNFVSLFDVPVTDAPRILTVETRDADGVVARAADSIIVAPTFPTAPAQGDSPDIATNAAAPVSRNTPDAEGDNAASADANDIQLAESETASSARPSSEAVPAEVFSSTTADVNSIAEPTQTAIAPSTGATRVTNTDDTIAAAPEIGAAPQQPTIASPNADVTTSTATQSPTPQRLFRAGAGGVTVLSDNATPPEARQDLGIDAISYDATGEVQLAGRGTRDTQLRIYLDNRPVQLARVDGGGIWASPLPNVESGTYTLRIDSLAADGSVTSRVETPFQRTAPEVAAASRRDGVTAITVQPGFTLWAISEGYFGDGIQYVQIFEANREFIRDPDLIFPGQVFNLPDAE